MVCLHDAKMSKIYLFASTQSTNVTVTDRRTPHDCIAKRETLYTEPICTIMQNFTPIGATVAEISVTGQRKKQQTY